MSLTSLGLVAALGAGILSFLSPCVIVLMPGYLCYLTGTSLQETRDNPTARGRVMLHAFWFVLGVTVVFVLLGAAVALLGSVSTPV
jgi:cytochrome c-type biogenesis protein